MSSRSTIYRVFCSLLLVLSLTVLSFADTIRLKDGSILKGRIVSFAGGKFTIAIGEGSRLKQLTYSATEIESIVFDAPDRAPMTTAARPSGDNPAIIKTSSTSTVPSRVVVTDSMPGTSVKTAPPVSKPVPVLTVKTAPANSDPVRTQPIAWTIKVLADNTANGWTNTGWVLKKGQRVRISGDGTVSLGRGKTSPPSGVAELEDSQKLLKNVATGALIAVIGDDNNDFIYIGAEREIIATRDGALFLGINEGILDDNTGAYNVKVEIVPGEGS